MRAVEFFEASGADEIVIGMQDAGVVTVPDTAHLFTAEFVRDGGDLVLQKDGAPDIRITGYFRQSETPDLQSPEGAVLRGHLVERLAGTEAPGQYAQAGTAQNSDPIGQVEAIVGGAYVQRTDGTRVDLELGVKVFQNDVVVTGASAKVSITFADGTIFSLASGSRMVLDELVYEQGGTENSGTFSLIEGSFVFIAGEVAKTGGIDVNTPTATMGIRGTTVKVDIKSESGNTTVYVSLNTDPDGGKGLIFLDDQFGNRIAEIDTTEEMWIISSDGETRMVERTAEDYANDAELLEEAANAYARAYQRVADGDSFVQRGSSSRQSDGTDEPGGQGDGQDGGANDNGGPGDNGETGGGSDGPPEDSGGTSIEEETRFLEDEEIRQAQDDTTETNEDGTVNISVLTNDQGTLNVISATDGSFGTTEINEDGTITYTPEENASGTDSFTYTVSDGQGSTDTATVTVTVAAVNDKPVTGNDLAAGQDNAPLTISVLSNDTDADGDPLTLVSVTDGSFGSTTINDDGTITYTPFAAGDGLPSDAELAAKIEGTIVEEEPAAETVTDSFTYTVSDGQGGTDTATVTVTLTLINDAPVATGESAETTEKEAISANLLANDTDIDGDALSLTKVNGLAFTGTTVVVLAGGVLTVRDNGSVEFDPNGGFDALAAGASQDLSFTYTISDGNGGTDTATASITVNGVNTAPVASDARFDIEDSEPIVIDVAALASDIDGTIDASSVTVLSAPLNGTTTNNGDGTITYRPVAGEPGTSYSDVFTFQVADDGGLTTSAEVVLNVLSAGSESSSEGVTLPGGQSFSVSLDAESVTNDDTTFVVVDLERSEVTNPNVNVSFVVDASGSVGQSQYLEQLEAIYGAIQQLRGDFEGSGVQVDVQIVRFATSSEQVTLDLFDPAIDAIFANQFDGSPDSSFPGFTGGFTDYPAALQDVHDFFAAQPVSEQNYLFFVSDGQPLNASGQIPDSAWQPIVDDILDSFAVESIAVGFGGANDNSDAQAALNYIDNTGGAEFVTAAENISEAFSASPLFPAELVEFELTLSVNGGPETIIEDSLSALTVNGLNFSLDLDAVSGLDNTAGAVNTLTATATFDTDNDLATLDDRVTLTTSLDVIGAAGAEIAESAGDDLVGGAGGSAVPFANQDGERVVYDQDADAFDGGSGRDTLVIPAGATLGSDLPPTLSGSDIEAIDMTNGTPESLSVGYRDVIDISSEADTMLETLLGRGLPESMTIYGDALDSVDLASDPDGSWQQQESVTAQNGSGLTVFAFSDAAGDVLATLAVSDDVQVNLPVA